VASPDLMSIIVLERPTAETREAVQTLIKKHASGWWHRFPDLWLASGHPPQFWRDEIRPLVAGTGRGVFVFLLPAAEADRAWAYFGPKAEERGKWLHDYYA